MICLSVQRIGLNSSGAVLVFQLPDDGWNSWGKIFFAGMLDEAYKGAYSHFNRPLIGDLRRISALKCVRKAEDGLGIKGGGLRWKPDWK